MSCQCSCAQSCASHKDNHTTADTANDSTTQCGVTPTASDTAAAGTMRTLRVNQRAEIVAINAAGETGRRMRDLGLRAGATFCVVGRAPLVDPVAIKIKGSILTLRNSEADHVLVKPLEK